MSAPPLNFKSRQERIKTRNSKPNSFFKKFFQRILEMPCVPQKSKWEAARTIQLAQKLEKNKNLSKPNASQKRVLWREMKGIWEK